MTGPPWRVLMHVQHLLGTGHLRRAAMLVRAMAKTGLTVDLVSGGEPVDDLDLGGARLRQLPPLRSARDSLNELVDVDGRPLDETWKSDRRDRLLALFHAIRPDVLCLESYPFGRRHLAFELLPLLDAARRASPRPIIVTSVRDILQKRRPKRIAETIEILERYVDRVLIHGDPRFILFGASFPEADRIAPWSCYTGYVVSEPAVRASPSDSGSGEVVVSAGGGAVGSALLRVALAARPRTQLRDARWRLITGQNLADEAFAELERDSPHGVTVTRFRPDFRRLLANCTVSVSQGGYNTVMDVLAARARAVIVPFVGQRQTEQSLRAHRLAQRALVHVVAEAELSAQTLAEAIDGAAASPPRQSGLDMNGAARSAQLLQVWLGDAAERRETA